mgnify:FL=1
MNCLKYLGLALLPILLASCKKPEEVYDYRDERYQDFYSRYMRKTQKDYLIIESKNIKEKLGIENIPDDVLARMNIYQANPQKAKNTPENNLQTQADVLKYRNRNGDHYAPCGPENQEPHFFCVEDKKSPGSLRYYYYLPNESKKIAYIDQPLAITCHPDDGKKRCGMMNWTNDPVNLELTMYFTDPQNFFYIIPYAEKHFYDAMGEHIWQNKAK